MTGASPSPVDRTPAPSWRGPAGALLLAAYGWLLWVGAREWFSEFGRTYVWTDILINYAGGFVRRGLLGEIAWRLDGVLPAPWFLTGLAVLLYALVAAWFIAAALRRPTLGALMLLFSPVGILYPLLAEDVFGRRDMIVAAALVGSVAAARLWPRRALAIAIGLFVFAGFAFETSWFYLPIAVAAIGRISGASGDWRGQAALWLPAAAVALASMAAIAVWSAATEPMKAAIVESWRQLYPGAYPSPGALQFMGWSLSQAIGFVVKRLEGGVGPGYFAGMALACLPLLLLWLERRAPRKGERQSWLVRGTTAIAVLAMLAPFVLGADWGRWVHLFTIGSGAFLLATRSPPEAAAAPVSPAGLVAGAALLLLYATSWSLLHYSVDSNPLLPGLLFEFTASFIHPR